MANAARFEENYHYDEAELHLRTVAKIIGEVMNVILNVNVSDLLQMLFTQLQVLEVMMAVKKEVDKRGGNINRRMMEEGKSGVDESLSMSIRRLIEQLLGLFA